MWTHNVIVYIISCARTQELSKHSEWVIVLPEYHVSHLNHNESLLRT